MAWFRRRHPATATAGTPTTELVPVEQLPESMAVAERTERAVIALAMHAAQLTDRLGQLEVRLDQLATHSDLLDVQIHSAKVAAEVSRLGVNLRAQIDDLRAHQRASTLAETIIDLDDGIDTRPGDTTTDTGSWARTA